MGMEIREKGRILHVTIVLLKYMTIFIVLKDYYFWSENKSKI